MRKRITRMGPVFIGRGAVTLETRRRSNRLTLDPTPIAWTVTGHRVYLDGRLYGIARDPYGLALEMAYGTGDTINGAEVIA